MKRVSNSITKCLPTLPLNVILNQPLILTLNFALLSKLQFRSSFPKTGECTNLQGRWRELESSWTNLGNQTKYEKKHSFIGLARSILLQTNKTIGHLQPLPFPLVSALVERLDLCPTVLPRQTPVDASRRRCDFCPWRPLAKCYVSCGEPPSSSGTDESVSGLLWSHSEQDPFAKPLKHECVLETSL